MFYFAALCDETSQGFVRGRRVDDETIDIKMGFKEISKIDVQMMGVMTKAVAQGRAPQDN